MVWKMVLKKHTMVQQFAASIPSLIENWYIRKAKLKRKYPTLTDSDLQYDEVKNGTILNKLRIKLGLNKEELQKIIS